MKETDQINEEESTDVSNHSNEADYVTSPLDNYMFDISSMNPESREALNGITDGNQVIDELVSLRKENEVLKTRYDNASSLIRKRFQDFKEEDKQRFRDIGHDLTGIAPVPEEYINDDWVFSHPEVSEKFKETCKSLDLNQEKANVLYDTFAASNAMQQDLIAKAREEYKRVNGEMLSKRWGDTYSEQVSNLGYFINDVVPKITGSTSEEFVSELKEFGIDDSAMLAQVFSAFGSMCRPTSYDGYNSVRGTANASLRLEELKNMPEFGAVFDKSHPKHEYYKAQYDSLLAEKHRNKG